MKMSCLLESPDPCLPLLAQFFDTFPSFFFRPSSYPLHKFQTNLTTDQPAIKISKRPKKIFSRPQLASWGPLSYFYNSLHIICSFHSTNQLSLIPSVGFTGPHHHRTSLNIKTQDSLDQIWKAKEVDYMSSLKRRKNCTDRKSNINSSRSIAYLTIFRYLQQNSVKYTTNVEMPYPLRLVGYFFFITLNDLAKKRGLRIYWDRISTANLKNSTAMSAVPARFSNYDYKILNVGNKT